MLALVLVTEADGAVESMLENVGLRDRRGPRGTEGLFHNEEVNTKQGWVELYLT